MPSCSGRAARARPPARLDPGPVVPSFGKTLPQGRASALQSAVGRDHADADDLARLPRAPSEHVAKDEHCPLTSRQMLNGGEKDQFDRLTGNDAVEGAGLLVD